MWVQEVIIQVQQRNGQPLSTTPTPDRVAKAAAIINEFIVSARIDDMITDGLHFARETYLPLLLEKEGQKETGAVPMVRAQIAQFEQQYPMQKAMLSSMGSAWLATMLSDEQMDELQKHMRGPGLAKLYKGIFESERAFTALTIPDAQAAKAYADDIIAKGLFKGLSSEGQPLLNADADALRLKWTARILESLTPATRDALVLSYTKLQELAKPLSNKPL